MVQCWPSNESEGAPDVHLHGWRDLQRLDNGGGWRVFEVVDGPLERALRHAADQLVAHAAQQPSNASAAASLAVAAGMVVVDGEALGLAGGSLTDGAPASLSFVERFVATGGESVLALDPALVGGGAGGLFEGSVAGEAPGSGVDQIPGGGSTAFAGDQPTPTFLARIRRGRGRGGTATMRPSQHRRLSVVG